MGRRRNEDQIGLNEDYNRIAILAASLKREELLTLDADTILRRLFWEEDVRRFEPLADGRALPAPARVSAWATCCAAWAATRSNRILAEQGQVEVGCDFCGAQYRFDPVDAAQLFPSRSGSRRRRRRSVTPAY